MNVFKDMLFINRLALKKSLKLFYRNWTIVFTGIIYSLLNIVLFGAIGFLFRGAIFGLFSGIIAAIVTSAMISNYLYLLFNIIRHGRFSLQDFKDGFKAFLWKVYGVLFIGWVSSLLFNRLVEPIIYGILPIRGLSLVISLLVLLILNALPESIYQKHYSSWETIVYAFNFIKENWVEWLIPNAVLAVILYYTTGNFISNLLSIHVGMIPSLSIYGILLYLVGQVIFSFTMIYRGVLFDILSTSTRRKRMFMRNLYD